MTRPLSEILATLEEGAETFRREERSHRSNVVAVPDHVRGTCAECARWAAMNHPLQHSCDEWYRVQRARNANRDAEELASKNAAMAQRLEGAIGEMRERLEALRSMLQTMTALTNTLHAESKCGGTAYDPCTVADDIAKARALTKVETGR